MRRIVATVPDRGTRVVAVAASARFPFPLRGRSTSLPKFTVRRSAILIRVWWCPLTRRRATVRLSWPDGRAVSVRTKGC